MWKPGVGALCCLVALSASAPARAAVQFIPPIAEYDHSLGRCSIIGGYVYRGTRGAVPAGAYVYGDLCTGEIFQLLPAAAGGTQTVLLDTTLNGVLSSFGEDEAAELYVVGLGGTVDRIEAGPPSSGTVVLQPVVNGLSSPLFVTHARDGTNRLFILEQAGVIKVLQPGSTTPTVFLDITVKVLSGGERGLLGLAFHPAYPTNRRFFVNYTRQPDGATVIAAYQATATDPNVADATESILLTIAQPFANHNGGMIEFGPDGCFIATAAYGSPLAQEVHILRRFRDRYLLTNTPGRLVVATYYRLSPPLARSIAAHDALRAAVGAPLRPVVWWAEVSLASPSIGVVVGLGALVAVFVIAWGAFRLRGRPRPD